MLVLNSHTPVPFSSAGGGGAWNKECILSFLRSPVELMADSSRGRLVGIKMALNRLEVSKHLILQCQHLPKQNGLAVFEITTDSIKLTDTSSNYITQLQLSRDHFYVPGRVAGQIQYCHRAHCASTCLVTTVLCSS